MSDSEILEGKLIRKHFAGATPALAATKKKPSKGGSDKQCAGPVTKVRDRGAGKTPDRCGGAPITVKPAKPGKPAKPAKPRGGK